VSNGTTTYQTFTVYPTLGDETWDQVALKVYGAERFANVLMAANPIYHEIVFFDSGMVLIIPQLTMISPVNVMPWNVLTQYS
jgi:hypothetical protein